MATVMTAYSVVVYTLTDNNMLSAIACAKGDEDIQRGRFLSLTRSNRHAGNVCVEKGRQTPVQKGHSVHWFLWLLFNQQPLKVVKTSCDSLANERVNFITRAETHEKS